MLRERQRLFVERMHAMAREHGSALGVAPTGMGKTVCLAALAQRERVVGPVLWVQHRAELLEQNERTLRIYDPAVLTSRVVPGAADFSGEVVFGMIQTLARRLPMLAQRRWTAILIDEAHHAPARSYRRVVEAVRSVAPDVRVYGVTATPRRGDGQGYHGLFHDIADVVLVDELIASGVLVRPRAFALALEKVEAIRALPKRGGEYDAEAAARLLEAPEFMGRIVREWRARCAERQTVVFCPTVLYSQRMAAMFREYEVAAEHVDGSMPADERADILRRFERGFVRVLTNCFVLSEGWDCPPVSCVILARPCANYSTMVQMIGRGLRAAPLIGKDDCIILDFGASLVTHGTITKPVTVVGKKPMSTVVTCQGCGAVYDRAEHKECPECGCRPPRQSIVGTRLRERDDGTLIPPEIELTEIDILEGTGLRWTKIDGLACWATVGRKAWGIVAKGRDDRWRGVVGGRGVKLGVVGFGESLEEVASAVQVAFLRLGNETPKHWFSRPATVAQRNLLKQFGAPVDRDMKMFEAACKLAFLLNSKRMERL